MTRRLLVRIPFALVVLARAVASAQPTPLAPAAPPAPLAPAAPPVRAISKDGFWINGGDGFALRTGLILQNDGRFYVDDDAAPHVDQLIFRSTRLDVSGTVLDHFVFKLMPDFANG